MKTSKSGFRLKEKTMGFSKEYLIFFKSAKRSNFAVKSDWKSKTSQNVQICFFLNEICGFFEKKFVIFLKTANDVKVVLGCNWISKISQKNEKLAPSWGKRFVFRRKNRSFLKTDKGSKFGFRKKGVFFKKC